MMKKGIFVIVSGPSGVGKDTLVAMIVKNRHAIYSISMTTRKKRNNEKEKVDYFFVSNDVFKENIKQGNLLEYAKYNDNYYGTLKDFVIDNINSGKNVIAILDVQGAMKVRKNYPEAILIFIMPPSIEELERRLRKRNMDSEEDIKRRIERAKEEINYKDKYDYVIVNDKINEAYQNIENILINNSFKISK